MLRMLLARWKPFKGQEYFSNYLSFVKKESLYPSIYKVDGPSTEPEVLVEGKRYLTFCSNNYLGIANHPRISAAAIEGIERYGIGSGSTRLLSGSLDIQAEFEKKLAAFLGYADAITFSSGYLANVGVIRMLIDPFPYFRLFLERSGVIFSDEYNHASIIDGVRLSSAVREIYPHNDMAALENRLAKHRKRRKLILTDGIFSMDGDAANLREITRLAKAYDALVMVDDSHGIGVLGQSGEGVAAAQGVSKQVDVLMGSFTKAFGSIGGFIACSDDISDYLRITARSYIFSDPILPAIVCSLIQALDIVKNDAERRQRTLANAGHLRAGFRDMGLTVLGEGSAIVPVLIGDEKKAMRLSDMLFEQHILAPCIRRPAVAEGKERIRFSVMATHTRDQLDRLLDIMKVSTKKSGIV